MDTKINNLLEKYVKSINQCDLEIAKEIWDWKGEVSFIHPLGYEYSYNDIIEHFYKTIMGGMFSKRNLVIKDLKYVIYGNTALVKFCWDFYAVSANTGEKIHTKGRESQFLVLQNNEFKITHIHYSPEPG